jgi:hypothetical protein
LPTSNFRHPITKGITNLPRTSRNGPHSDLASALWPTAFPDVIMKGTIATAPTSTLRPSWFGSTARARRLGLARRDRSTRPGWEVRIKIASLLPPVVSRAMEEFRQPVSSLRCLRSAHSQGRGTLSGQGSSRDTVSVFWRRTGSAGGKFPTVGFFVRLGLSVGDANPPHAGNGISIGPTPCLRKIARDHLSASFMD